MKANFHIFSFVPHVFSVRPKTCYEIQVHEYLPLFFSKNIIILAHAFIFYHFVSVFIHGVRLGVKTRSLACRNQVVTWPYLDDLALLPKDYYEQMNIDLFLEFCFYATALHVSS